MLCRRSKTRPPNYIFYEVCPQEAVFFDAPARHSLSIMIQFHYCFILSTEDSLPYIPGLNHLMLDVHQSKTYSMQSAMPLVWSWLSIIIRWEPDLYYHSLWPYLCIVKLAVGVGAEEKLLLEKEEEAKTKNIFLNFYMKYSLNYRGRKKRQGCNLQHIDQQSAGERGDGGTILRQCCIISSKYSRMIPPTFLP